MTPMEALQLFDKLASKCKAPALDRQEQAATIEAGNVLLGIVKELDEWKTVDDGMGTVANRCKPGCNLHVVRPGDLRCNCKRNSKPKGEKVGKRTQRKR